MNITQVSPFKYNVGDKVILGFDPLSKYGLNAVIKQQIRPLKFPDGSFTSDTLKLLPRARKEFRPTRELSYLLLIDDTDLNVWATERCILG